MPFTNKLFSGIQTSRMALNARMERQGLIQSNVANMETPGYTVQDFSFEAVMKNAMQRRGQLAQTSDRHIALDPITLSESLEFRDERRPVDLDEEMQKLSENQLMFQVTSKIVASRFDGLKLAIDEGGK